MNMHRARHTFATELRRGTGDLGVMQRMLGHSDIHTTEAFYGHYDVSDLGVAMEAFARRDEGSQLTGLQTRNVERTMGAPGIEPGTSRV